MRVLLAPDKFKGTFSAAEICEHLRSGILEAHPSAEVISHPLADGGEGTLEVLLSSLGGVRIPVRSQGPLGDRTIADVGRLPDGVVVVESAHFCGLGQLRADERNPIITSTYGLGLALREVLSWRPPGVMVGLGGSATVDCGLGAARAFGFRLLGHGGSELAGNGGDLGELTAIWSPAPVRISGVLPKIRALCDVRNPLIGPEGAAEVFAPQKGASREETARLASGLEHAARIIHRDVGIDVRNVQGGGAAGGLGAGLHACLGAELIPGAGEIMRLTRFDDVLVGVDAVITGEGSYDGGSRQGKVVEEVARRSLDLGIPVVVVCGRWEAGASPLGSKVIQSEGVMTGGTLREVGRRLFSCSVDQLGGEGSPRV